MKALLNTHSELRLTGLPESAPIYTLSGGSVWTAVPVTPLEMEGVALNNHGFLNLKCHLNCIKSVTAMTLLVVTDPIYTFVIRQKLNIRSVEERN